MRPAIPLALLLILLLAPGGPAAGAGRIDLAEADLDGDGLLTLEDARKVCEHLGAHDTSAYRGDINGDRVISDEDVELLLRILVHRTDPKRELPPALLRKLVRRLAKGAADETAGAEAAALDALLASVATTKGPLEEVGRELETLLVTPGRTAGEEAFVQSLLALLAAADAERDRQDFRGREPSFPHDLARYPSGLDAAPPAAAKPIPDYPTIYGWRTRMLDKNLRAETVGELFASFENRDLSGLPGSDSPDSKLFPAGGERTADPRPDDDAGATIVGPGAEFGLDVPAADPERMGVRDDGERTADPLRDEYGKVAPPTSGLAIPGLDAWLDDDVKKRSDDPLTAQTMRDLSSVDLFTSQADRDGDGTLTRAEFFAQLYSPESAIRILTGRAADAGLAPDGSSAVNYREIAGVALPELVRAGLVSQAYADAAREAMTKADEARTLGLSPEKISTLLSNRPKPAAKKPPRKTATVGSGGKASGSTGKNAFTPRRMKVDTSSNIGLNVRAGPSVGTKDLGTLPEGSSITVIGKEGDWYKVRWNGKTAYCHGAYLK